MATTKPSTNSKPPAPPKSSIDVDKIDRNINESVRRQVSDAIMKNPEMVLSVLRGWKDNNR